MPKPISRRLDYYLMAYKGSKPKVVTPAPVKSSFNGVNDTEFNTPFGTNTTTQQSYKDPVTGKQASKIITNSTLSPQLQGASDQASSGLNSNLTYLGDPTQQIAGITGGSDPLYNYLEHSRQLNNEQAAGRAAVNAQGTGNLDSTAYGSQLGYLQNQDNINQNNNVLQTLDYNNSNSRGNVATNLAALQGLAGLSYGPASASNANLITANNANNQVGLANSAQNVGVQEYNSNAQYQAALANQAALGNNIGAALGTVASVGLAPFTGGASLLALPGTLSKFGSSGGAGGGSLLPSGGGTASFSMPTTGGGLGGGSGVPSIVNQLGGSSLDGFSTSL